MVLLPYKIDNVQKCDSEIEISEVCTDLREIFSKSCTSVLRHMEPSQ
jgi:hypothetical protein